MRKWIGVSWYCRSLVGPSICVCRRALDSGSLSSAIASTVRLLNRSTSRCRRALDRISLWSTRGVSVMRRHLTFLAAWSSLTLGRSWMDYRAFSHRETQTKKVQTWIVPCKCVVSSGTHRKHSNEYTPNTWEDAEVFENVELHVVGCTWLLRKK